MTIIDQTPTDASTAPALPAYRLAGVTKTYTQKGRIVHALEGVDVEIGTGDFVTIQGPTGGGKSTLLQLLGALDVPTSGHVLIGDTDLAAASPAQLASLRAREIAFVFQSFNLIPTLTAAENVAMGLEPLGLDRAERDARVADALARVGLSERGDHRPGELSGGQQQRVAIARAIAKRPPGAARRRADGQPRRADARRDPDGARAPERRGADPGRGDARLGGGDAGATPAAARSGRDPRHHAVTARTRDSGALG